MTDTGLTKTRKRSYNKISDVQRSKLQEYFDGGMQTCGSDNQGRIRMAADETGLSVDQVKKWIGNTKAKAKKHTSQSGIEAAPHSHGVKIPTGCRGSSAYNMFCADFFKSDECKELSLKQKNQEAAKKWRDKTPAEKESYKEKADSLKAPDVSKLSEEQKIKLISVHRESLLNEIQFLEHLGCEMSLIYKDTEGQVYNFGSNAGYSFLCLNPEVNIKFRDHFACTNEKYTCKDVQQLFNTKYSEAVNKPGSRVPYLRGGFTVENLPDGITLKKPFHYGSKQLQAIMEKKDQIKFVINTSVNLPSDRDVPPSATQPADQELITLLSKIVDGECAERVVTMSEKIKEQDVEVMALELNQEERLRLNSCSHFFEDDAWLAVGANLQHSKEVQGLIVPVLSGADDEKFWLFYTFQKPSKLVKASCTQKLKGYWLDSQDHLSYRLLINHQDSVTIANVIKNGPYGPLYYLQTMEISDDQYYNIPKVFKDAIISTF